MFKIKFPNKKGTKEGSSIDNGLDNMNSRDKNKEAYQRGLDIANVLTYFWNSQKAPGKIYICNRRVHHGEIGSLLGLSNLFKKSQPIPSGILTGLGKGLVKDDYADKDEWFKFKRKDELQSPETNTNATLTTESKEQS